MLRFKNLLNLASDKLHTLPMLILYLTDGCNSRCVTCDIWKNPRRNMPLALVDSIVETVDELGTRYVLLSGGEAMQHPQWDEIARRFHQKNVHVMLLTNGILLKKQAARLVGTVDEVIVSLDGGTAESYDAIRGVDAFDLILEGIDAVRDLGLPVTTRTTIQRMNYHEMQQIIDVGLAHDVNTISFLAMDVSNPFAFGDRDITVNSDALAQKDLLELSDIIDALEAQYTGEFVSGRIAESPTKLRRTLLNYFEAINGDVDFPQPPCNAPHFSTVIEVDGRLRPCYFLPSYGRLKPQGESLTGAINWQVAQDLRKAYRTGQRKECKRCVCPLYKSPRAMLRM